MMPTETPPIMLLLKGMPAKMRKAGIPSVQSSHRISETERIIMAPTTTSAPDVTGGYPATAVMIGVKNIASRKQMPITMAVSPVFPPASAPAALSR